MLLICMNVSHYVSLRFEQINEQFQKYDYNPMGRILGVDGYIGTNLANFDQKYRPKSIAGQR